VSADTGAQPQFDPPDQPQDTRLSVIRSWFSTLADLAPTLKEAELRVLLELSRRQLASPDGIRASGRDLATACKCGRRNVQYALDSLTSRNLITTRQGTPTSPAAYRVAAFDTVRIGGVATTPPPPAQRPTGGVATTPPLASLHRHGGVITTPPLFENAPLLDRAAPLDFERTSYALIDRVLSAKTSKTDRDELARFRQYLASYFSRFGRDDRGQPLQSPPPPTDDLVAQFLAIAEPARMATMLDNLSIDALAAHAHHPGSRGALNPTNYAWFITVALSRVHGISFQVTRKIRADLREVKRQRQEPEQIALPDMQDLARKKSMK
jgi:hypothetical protein